MLAHSNHPDKNILRILVGTTCWIGFFAVIELFITAAYGSRPSLDQSSELIVFMERTADLRIGFLLADIFLLAGMMVFFAALGQLIVRQVPKFEWIMHIAYVFVAIFVVLLLIGGALNAIPGIIASEASPDASAIRSLLYANVILYGPVAAAYCAFGTALYSFLLIASKALPARIGQAGLVCAGLNLLVLPTIYGGMNANSYTSIDGATPLLLGIVPGALWILVIGWTAYTILRSVDQHSSASLLLKVKKRFALSK